MYKCIHECLYLRMHIRMYVMYKPMYVCTYLPVRKKKKKNNKCENIRAVRISAIRRAANHGYIIKGFAMVIIMSDNYITFLLVVLMIKV